MTMLRVIATLGFFLGGLRGELRDIDFRDLLSEPANQRSCGGCYGFAEAATIEWFVANLTGKLIPLSTQFYVDCMEDSRHHSTNGCKGGVVTNGLKYLLTYQYHPYAEDYPFTGNYDAQTCIDNGFKDRKRRNALADVWIFNYLPVSRTAQAMREALQKSPVIAPMYISEELFGWKGRGINTDETCDTAPLPHSLTFVGWQSNNGNPYYILRNSFGPDWGDNGYAYYADNKQNTFCRYYKQAVTLSGVGRRREIQYKLGAGRKKFEDAQKWCQAQNMRGPENRKGWDLAVIPTLMHNFEVYDLITSKYGRNRKADNEFNFIWIGMIDQQWVDGTEVNFVNWDDYEFKHSHTAMLRIWPGKEMKRGRWTTRRKNKLHRFVCSRYRAEHCPRISQTAVDNAEALTMLDSSGSVTKEIDVGTIAVVECVTGYKRIGPEITKCQEDGAWTQLPSCAAPS